MKRITTIPTTPEEERARIIRRTKEVADLLLTLAKGWPPELRARAEREAQALIRRLEEGRQP